MDLPAASFWMTAAGTICWIVCFVWMGRISAKQNFLLDRLSEQTRRIEKLSKLEHDLIKEVHPQVGEIKENMEEMMSTVKQSADDMMAAVKQNGEDAEAARDQKR